MSKITSVLVAALLAFAGIAHAQTPQTVQLAGYLPSGVGTLLTATTGGVSATLPTGAIIAVFNKGDTNAAYCRLGATAAVTDVLVAPLSWYAFQRGNNTQITCITASSTTAMNIVGGSGTPMGAGGGGGGGGGGGSGLSVTDGAAYVEDTSPFTPTGCTFTDAAALAAGTQGMVRCTTKRAFIMDTDTTGSALYTAITSSIPAGSALIGDVNLRQAGTALGTTNGIYSNLLQGNAVISATNGVYSNLLQGNAVLSASNGLFLASTNPAIPLWGLGVNGATAPANSQLTGCRAADAAPTEVTNGQMAAIQCGLGGKLVNQPYAVKELLIRGTTTSTDTSAHTIIASAGGSLKNYITGVQCYNSSATSVVITFNDSVTTPLYLPSTGGNNANFAVPIVTAAATAFQFTSPSGLTTIGCAAQGYTGL